VELPLKHDYRSPDKIPVDRLLSRMHTVSFFQPRLGHLDCKTKLRFSWLSLLLLLFLYIFQNERKLVSSYFCTKKLSHTPQFLERAKNCLSLVFVSTSFFFLLLYFASLLDLTLNKIIGSWYKRQLAFLFLRSSFHLIIYKTNLCFPLAFIFHILSSFSFILNTHVTCI
jgi:hypothetical protein